MTKPIRAKTSAITKWGLVLVAVGVVAEIASMPGRSAPGVSSDRAVVRPTGDTWASNPIAAEQAHDMVRKVLKDPGSAQFGEDEVVHTAADYTAVCGSVNSKNSFGGYTGAKRYVISTTGFEMEGQGTWPKRWNRECVRHDAGTPKRAT